jgi:hypothetical protein
MRFNLFGKKRVEDEVDEVEETEEDKKDSGPTKAMISLALPEEDPEIRTNKLRLH